MQPDESGKNISFEFDAEIYSEQAVKSAFYDLSIVADIFVVENNRRTIQAKLHAPKDNDFSFKKKIYNAILDHQIRIDIQKETGPIRKLIIAQAFFPCENLEQILDGMDL